MPGFDNTIRPNRYYPVNLNNHKLEDNKVTNKLVDRDLLLTNNCQKIFTLYQFMKLSSASNVPSSFKVDILMRFLKTIFTTELLEQYGDLTIFDAIGSQINKCKQSKSEDATDTNNAKSANQTLDFSSKNINIKDVFIKLLLNKSTVTQVDLRNNNLKESITSLLCKFALIPSLECLDISSNKIKGTTNELKNLTQTVQQKSIAETLSNNRYNIQLSILCYYILFLVDSINFKNQAPCNIKLLKTVWDFFIDTKSTKFESFMIPALITINTDNIENINDKLSQLYENFNKLNEALFDLNKLTLDQDKKLKLLEILSLQSYEFNTKDYIEKQLDLLNATITKTLKSFYKDKAILSSNAEENEALQSKLQLKILKLSFNQFTFDIELLNKLLSMFVSLKELHVSKDQMNRVNEKDKLLLKESFPELEINIVNDSNAINAQTV